MNLPIKDKIFDFHINEAPGSFSFVVFSLFFFLSKLFAFEHFFLEAEVPKEICCKFYIHTEMRMNCLNLGNTLA